VTRPGRLASGATNSPRRLDVVPVSGSDALLIGFDLSTAKIIRDARR